MGPYVRFDKKPSCLHVGSNGADVECKAFTGTYAINLGFKGCPQESQLIRAIQSWLLKRGRSCSMFKPRAFAQN